MPVQPLIAGAPLLIVDQDMISDIDDLGALAVAHALADLGECQIIGCMASSTNGATSMGMNAVNTWYGRPNIPIGVRTGTSSFGNYPGTIANEYQHPLLSYTQCTDAGTLYRQLLAAAPDNSVKIAVTGFLSNVKALLNSTADGISSLNGHDLVVQKVKELVVMGGTYPSGNEFNFQSSGDDSAFVVGNNWPAPVTYTGGEIGSAIMTGAALATAHPNNSPIRRGWEVFNGIADRASWDQTAVYIAVRPADGTFSYHATGRNNVNADYSNFWSETTPPALQRYTLQVNATTAQTRIAALMAALPAATPYFGSGTAKINTSSSTRYFNASGSPRRAVWRRRGGL